MVIDYRALLCEGTEALSGVSDTPRLDSEVLLAYLSKKERVWFAIHANETADEDTCAAFRALIARRAKGEPVAYITGMREFMGLPFRVRPGILIPRPDTETLVEAVLEEAHPSSPRIIDLCTGSGAIAVSLAHFMPQASVCAVDISAICTETAAQNAAENGVCKRIHIVRADILADGFSLTEPDAPADILVSNPPYIETSELHSLMTDVKDYEPSAALDGGADGLVFYRKITAMAPSLLRPGGLLAFEVGHNQAEAVGAILKLHGFTSIRYACDLAGIRRVVLARNKNETEN